MHLLMEASWTGHATYERVAGIVKPLPQTDNFKHLPADLMHELTDSFAVFDCNGDGRICKAEFGAAMRALGSDDHVTDADLEELVKGADANGDGYLDLHEFVELNTRAMKLGRSAGGAEAEASAASDELLSAFGVFDADRNGLISAEELQRVLVALGDEEVSVDECRQMIGCADKDGDQMVDFGEFEALMTGSARVH